jgi:hypothetical protein
MNIGTETINGIIESSGRAVHDDVTNWIRPESDSFTIVANENKTLNASLYLPSTAHCGEYIIYVTFKQTIAKEAEEGTVMKVGKGVSVPISFTVAGVDLWSAPAIPKVMKSGDIITNLVLPLGNYLNHSVNASVVLQIKQNGNIIKEIKTDYQTVNPSPPSTDFKLDFDTTGLADGKYTLLTFAEYDGKTTTTLTQEFWIGEAVLEILKNTMKTTVGNWDNPCGKKIDLPRYSNINLVTQTENKGNIAAEKEILVEVTGATKIDLRKKEFILPGETKEISNTFNLGEAMEYKVNMHDVDEDKSICKFTINALEPDIKIENANVVGNNIYFEVYDANVITKGSVSAELLSAFDQKLKNVYEKEFIIKSGERQIHSATLDLSEYPRGLYKIKFRAVYTGGDVQVIKEFEITAPGAIAADYILILIIVIIVLLAAILYFYKKK